MGAADVDHKAVEKGVAPLDASNQILAVPAKPPVKIAKPRIECIDGCRFALVMPIMIGHFVKFATDNRIALKLLTQENVLVGGFFIISGYVAGYVSTNMGEQKHDEKKLAKPELYFWQKVMSYYPLHFVVSTAFAPMFIQIDRWMKNSCKTTLFNAFLNYSLLQAWFPSSAEIWNPPTWFLSALTFANVTLPSMILPAVSRLSKEGVTKLLYSLGAMSCLQKLSYSQSWQFTCRGNYTCKTSLPKLWNVTRFHPVWALIEVVMGVCACRTVMLDSQEERKAPVANPLWYFIASYATLALRLTRFNLNDALIRSCLFIPLYVKFLTTMHRDCMSEKPRAITRFFGTKQMTFLGSLAFPMFILHGPVGQLFYKKKVAFKLWGGVMPKSFFPVYLAIVMLAGHLMNEGFVKNKTVQKLAARLAEFLAKKTEGFLQDKRALAPLACSSASQ
mmetsp:Transcript_54527/g.130048  ORF Transcript_54527/g.130048 Transcript_54527/m.130048 type:complete len:447 (+) Transcript_54527:124-1464(+)|eukprot:CAMPEP_0178425762 /NCGR_PEP_ID=MMETSP0689_2-20121128/28887_1 /TAXON_ID=160604 /ORGANISM="Amphidinium massartii, Strain CS-259" /LENGTH=446 /DNA_ID=CAMNT_0020047429 /DNA_START=48 /DNA_END=1388 /DNA_ORIENTATION=+